MLSIDLIAGEQQLSISAIKSKFHKFTLALLIFGVVSAILNNVEKQCSIYEQRNKPLQSAYALSFWTK
jgi:hypothetical protein